VIHPRKKVRKTILIAGFGLVYLIGGLSLMTVGFYSRCHYNRVEPYNYRAD